MDYDITLGADEIRRLVSAERIGVLASSNPDGTPHAAPIWPVLVGEDLYVETETVSRKARNLMERPAFAFVMGLGVWGPSVVLLGRAAEVADGSLRGKVREVTAIRYYGSTAHKSFKTIERQYERFGGSTVFRLDWNRAVSWDYEKLPSQEWILPSSPPDR